MRWHVAMARAAEFSARSGQRYRVYGLRYTFGWRYFLSPTTWPKR